MRVEFDRILVRVTPIVVFGGATFLLMITLLLSSELYSSVQEGQTILVHATSRSHKDTVVSCYYNTPSRDGEQLLPSAIQPHLCTHINVAFARVRNKQIYLDDNQYHTIRQVVKLKQENPSLKVLLSVGGSEGEVGFRDMVVDHASRKIFIKSIKAILRNYTLDGIDLDWEFPEIHKFKRNKGSRERQHFSQLLREIRMEYIREHRDYLLTVAVAAPEMIVDVSYDVDEINKYTDFVNIMTYDFHYYTKYTPFTGFNSPLLPRSSESLYMAQLNINYTVHMYLKKGLDRDKIVVGIPTYGHTFTLVNTDNTNIGSPASGYGALGSLGFVNYPDVCSFAHDSNVTIVFDDEAKVPYAHRQKEWVSFESPLSVMEKAKYIKDNGLRGAMLYSLNADDYNGLCMNGSNNTILFPLAQSVKNALFVEDGEDLTLI